jgi:hypothetical protein
VDICFFFPRTKFSSASTVGSQLSSITLPFKGTVY